MEGPLKHRFILEEVIASVAVQVGSESRAALCVALRSLKCSWLEGREMESRTPAGLSALPLGGILSWQVLTTVLLQFMEWK